MSIPVPTAGAPILDTWGAAITQKVNRLIPLQMAADFESNSTGLVDCEGLSFDAVSGKVYSIHLVAFSRMLHASSQCQWGVEHAGGDFHMYFRAATTGPTTEELARQTATGTPTSFGNCGTVGNARHCIMTGRFVASADGEFSIVVARSGTSGGLVVLAGSGGLVIESA